MPVLVLNGELDQSTPVADARHVANAFPNATFVEVPNTAHVSALYDFQHCASHIVRRFCGGWPRDRPRVPLPCRP